MTEKKKIYFISDVHLGLPDYKGSLEKEKLLVKWLDEVSKDAQEIYMLGDIFDVWFEYKRVAPRGYVRFLGKLAELTDKGLAIHFFAGNHDHWITDYLPSETGVILHRDRLVTDILGKTFFMAHGDGLGPSDKGYKLMKKVFTNPAAKWCYSRLHPNFAIGLATRFSIKSRKTKKEKLRRFNGEENEWLVKYAKRKLETNHYDYFVFGHRHLAANVELNEKSTLFNLGDWLTNYTYGVFDGNTFELKSYKQ